MLNVSKIIESLSSLGRDDLRAVITSASQYESARAEEERVQQEEREESQAAMLHATRALAQAAHEDGEDWTQPSSATDAYLVNSTVRHNGATWASLVDYNVWEPGASGWREVTAEGEAPAEWVRPSGATDAYRAGDEVTFEGVAYYSLVDGNVWSPSEYPASWERIS